MTIERAADSAELQKERGAFFTPPQVTTFLAKWGVREASDRVLEPSCGDGAILSAAVERLQDLGGKTPLRAHELHQETAAQARELVAAMGHPAEVLVGDFLTARPESTFDAVLGNPPYVRYQGFTGDARAAGLSAALAQGVRLSRLSSSWAPFVIHASAFLKEDGRMALVLPAELLSSNYAQDVRDFLIRRFASVDVVSIERQVFEGVQTEALLLLAQGSGGTSRVRFAFVRSASDLADVEFTVALDVEPGRRWTTALVSPDATKQLEGLTGAGQFSPLSDWGRITLGAVTGSNNFFTLSPAEVTALGLEPADLVPISPAGSSHLRALTLTKADHEELGARGAKTLLFRPKTPSKAARAYISLGERVGVNDAYKCRVRSPWWRTPLTAPPSLFFTYMNEGTPQLAANPGRLFCLNSVHGLYLNEALDGIADVLPLAALNSVTGLSAEITGRAYGGGVLKMEPREAAQLLVPSPDTVWKHESQLRQLIPEARELLKAGRLAAARSAVDAIVLGEENGRDVAAVGEAHLKLVNRRRARASSSRVKGQS